MIGNNQTRSRLAAAIFKWWRQEALAQCLVSDPTCKGGICRAHSIPVAGALNRISVSGHVCIFKRVKGAAKLVRVGVRKAGTFTGFCHHHDNTLFREVDFDETRKFDPNDMQQCVLLSLRAAAAEYWAKLNAAGLAQQLASYAKNGDIDAIKRQLNIDDQSAQYFVQNVDTIHAEYARGMKRGRSRMKRVFGSLLTQARTGRFHLSRKASYFVLGEPTVAAAAITSPEFDFADYRIASLALHSDPPNLAVIVIPEEAGTHVVFLWHRRHSPVVEPLLLQLDGFHESQRRIALSKLLLIHIENFALSPRLADQLSGHQRASIEKAFHDSVLCGVPYRDVPECDFFSAKWTHEPAFC